MENNTALVILRKRDFVNDFVNDEFKFNCLGSERRRLALKIKDGKLNDLQAEKEIAKFNAKAQKAVEELRDKAKRKKEKQEQDAQKRIEKQQRDELAKQEREQKRIEKENQARRDLYNAIKLRDRSLQELNELIYNEKLGEIFEGHLKLISFKASDFKDFNEAFYKSASERFKLVDSINAGKIKEENIDKEILKYNDRVVKRMLDIDLKIERKIKQDEKREEKGRIKREKYKKFMDNNLENECLDLYGENEVRKIESFIIYRLVTELGIRNKTAFLNICKPAFSSVTFTDDFYDMQVKGLEEELNLGTNILYEGRIISLYSLFVVQYTNEEFIEYFNIEKDVVLEKIKSL